MPDEPKDKIGDIAPVRTLSEEPTSGGYLDTRLKQATAS